jgi:lipopolysaccharide transport system permease protein
MAEKVTYISANQKIPLCDFRELWQYRDLLLFFILRDFKVRYRQTILGFGWALLQPLLQLTIFTILFGRLLKIGAGNQPYVIFVLAGLIPWNFFANGINAANYAILNHAGLLRKIYFPRLLIPLSALGITLVDLLLTLLIFAGLALYYHLTITWQVLLFCPLFILLMLLTLGLGAYLSALGARYRDVRHVIPFFMQIWLFLTPVFYPLQVLQGKFQLLLYLNPVTGIITNLRAVLLNQPPNLMAFFTTLIWTLVLLPGGLWYYQKQARRFADYI